MQEIMIVQNGAFAVAFVAKPIVEFVDQLGLAIGESDLLAEEQLDVTVDVPLVSRMSGGLNLLLTVVLVCPFVEKFDQRIAGGVCPPLAQSVFFFLKGTHHFTLTLLNNRFLCIDRKPHGLPLGFGFLLNGIVMRVDKVESAVLGLDARIQNKFCFGYYHKLISFSFSVSHTIPHLS